ncbi:hypothetical protein PGT21_007882 [Puccinia graminis f. sp. tritici]|uniref:Uncharacterized protein n=1 Tax=Puccinia graminis f. sp. tritici TaxID=56615 RepID=A0A5B0MKX5_PUCGR|nr:hypothetical protein PGT21_007882 [Puccinia graminis f. sp. tritici]KAA1135504.1 hypothetical protein PGTUg99_008396 [Puccinia graminis f. sp. tritici]
MGVSKTPSPPSSTPPVHSHVRRTVLPSRRKDGSPPAITYGPKGVFRPRSEDGHPRPSIMPGVLSRLGKPSLDSGRMRQKDHSVPALPQL